MEELPLHRVLDLAILVCRTRQYSSEEAYRHEKLYDEENTQIDRVPLQGDAMIVEVYTDNPMLDYDIQLFQQALGKDDEMVSERLKVLGGILRKLGY